MKYAAVFVAMSRVKKRKHIRLLEPFSVNSREDLYGYLESIRPDKNIAPFMHGYRSFGSKWDPMLALSYSKKNKKN